MLLVNTMAGAMLTTLLFAVVFIIEAHKENTRLTNAALEQERKTLQTTQTKEEECASD